MALCAKIDDQIKMSNVVCIKCGTKVLRPAGKIRANSATRINSYSGRVVQVGIDSGCRSVG